MINVKGKRKIFKGIRGSRSSYKKAVVTVKKGQSIDYTDSKSKL